MKIASGRVLDRLTAEEPCLGALFTSFSFDPAFFEDHVLRAVLRLTSDPVEQAVRYHHEARRALQETAVVAIVDAAERRPGRRLPFDLLEVSGIVFHPKSALLLYRKYARLLIGSGNLTFSGYGGNTELFFCADLAYDESADAALLKAFDEHLTRVRSLVRKPGTQLDLFCEELRRRLRPAPSDAGTASLALLDSTTEPIIKQLESLLPDNAVVDSIGTLAPFYERDDDTELDVTSVLGALAPRAAKGAVLDVGVAWDNPQVHASSGSELNEGLGRIWTRSYERHGTRLLEHLVPVAIGPNTLSYTDETGNGRRWGLEGVREQIEQRALWMQPPPIAFAPHNTVASATERFSEVRLWLHPATRLVDGRPVHRPLHAKMFLVGYRSGRSRSTLVVIGSPNMSRRALLMRAGVGQGNVEVALAFRVDFSASLRDFVPELIYAPPSAFELQERKFPERGRNYALAIDEAVHDPRAGTLIVSWSSEAADLPAWELTYDDLLLASASMPPIAPVAVPAFVLKPSTAEVVLHVDGREYPAPILVTDLVALPAAPAVPSLGLNELLMLLGRRIGTERAIQIAGRRGEGTGDSDELSAFFGDGFGPTDVFRAWWAVAEDISDPNLSVQAFRLRIEGALGVGAAWACMVDAAAQKTIPAEEVWFYGAELVRELGAVQLAPSDDRVVKAAVLSRFRDHVQKDLREFGLQTETRTWVKRVLAFYGETDE